MKKTVQRLFGICGIMVVLASGLPAVAQEVHEDFRELVKAEVLEVTNEYERDIMGTGAVTTVQELRLQLLEGERTGEVVTVEIDVISLAPGDKIFVNRYISIDGSEYVTFQDVERRPPLVFLGAIFVGLVVWLSGWQGVRAVVSLGISIAAVLFLLIPALLAGYSPALASLVIAGLILATTLFFTHGFKPRVFVTFLGTFGAVFATCIIAWIWTSWMRFTGYADDSAVYLNFASGGQIDLAGLLLGGIIIGLLGVLDDVSITQASVVQELKASNPALGFRQLYTRALRVGKDHVGSLVNTLALAYVGASLPMLLLLGYSKTPILTIINQEIIAAEIVRIVVGSIGLILAVPLTTLLAAWYFKDRYVDPHEDHGHSHGHAHSHEADEPEQAGTAHLHTHAQTEQPRQVHGHAHHSHHHTGH